MWSSFVDSPFDLPRDSVRGQTQIKMLCNTFRRISLLLVALFLQQSVGTSSSVLVLVDSLVTRETHSQFLRHLQQQGHQLTIKPADDSTLQLTKYGRHLFDHLILLSPGVDEFGGSLSVASIVEYVDNGGNLLVIGDVDSGDAIRELVTEFGLELDEEGTTVVDHFSFDARLDNGSHNVILSTKENLLNAPQIVGPVQQINSVLYRGSALFTSTNKPNPLLFKVFTAPPTAYSYAPNKQIVEVSLLPRVRMHHQSNEILSSLPGSQCRGTECHPGGRRPGTKQCPCPCHRIVGFVE